MLLFLAAERANLTVKDIGVPPTAVAASKGLYLCQTPSDYDPYDPERVMSLYLRGSTLTTAVQRISRNAFILHDTPYSVRHDVGEKHLESETTVRKEATQWINDFAKDQDATKLFLLWSEEANPTFRDAVQDSALSPVLLETIERAIAQGKTATTKKKMESQDTDCLESVKCGRVRKKADRLTGQPPGKREPPRSEL